jgi:hypothetical protein
MLRSARISYNFLISLAELQNIFLKTFSKKLYNIPKKWYIISVPKQNTQRRKQT